MTPVTIVRQDLTITAAPDADTALPFTSLAWVEGRWTGDGRFVMVDGVVWDGILPAPLTVMHEGVLECIGRVDELARTPGASADERFIMAKGVVDPDAGPADGNGVHLGAIVADLIRKRYVRGVSMELDAVVEGGIDPDTSDDDMPAGSGGWVMVTETARFRALSVVTTGAFAEAFIAFDDDMPDEALPPAIDGPEPVPASEMPDEPVDDVVIIASAGHTIVLPKVPPAEWFTEPTDVGIEGALTITDEGRVYGYLAPGNVPYSGVAGNFTAPMGAVNYRDWMRGETVVEGGDRVVTGNITMGCGHGDAVTTDHAAVREHYDNSCSLFAKVAAGENQHGVWVAGALYPGVTSEQVERAMGLSCSGHWLPSLTPGYRYDLLAALLVPVPGFAMARRAPSVTYKDGAMAASAVPVKFESDCGCGGNTHDAMSGSELKYLATIERRLARLEQANRPALVASLRDRIGQ